MKGRVNQAIDCPLSYTCETGSYFGSEWKFTEAGVIDRGLEHGEFRQCSSAQHRCEVHLSTRIIAWCLAFAGGTYLKHLRDDYRQCGTRNLTREVTQRFGTLDI